MRAVLASVAVLFGAVSCADAGLTEPLTPIDPLAGLEAEYDSIAPMAEKLAAPPTFNRGPNVGPLMSVSGSGSLTNVQSIAFAPEAGPFQNQLPGCPDCTFGGTGGFPIGFSFNFYGSSYSSFWISSNGWVSFTRPSDQFGGCCNGRPLPLLDKVNNMVALAWVDLEPTNGQMSFETRGEAPRRRLIVNYNNVLLFNEGGRRVTAQLILYEGTNTIEVHTTALPAMVNHTVSQGAENAAATEAAFGAGRIATKQLALSSDAIRFSAPVANNVPSANAGGNAGSAPNKFYEGVEGVPVTFVGSGVDADNDPLSYSWDFDGDGIVDAQSAEASFVYADNGTHSALLKVSDGRGGVAEARVDVVVRNADPVVNAGADVRVLAGSMMSLAGQFSDKGANDALWSWTWDLGALGSYSGKTDDQSAPILGSKKLCKAGSFPVKLTVIDKDKGLGSDELVVKVDALPVEIAVEPKAINLSANGHGMITVKIFSRGDLDATALRPESIKLTNGLGSGTAVARNGGRLHWSADADLNGDGRLDVVAGFRRDELIASGDLTRSTDELRLSGEVGTCGDVLATAPVHVIDPARTAR